MELIEQTIPRNDPVVVFHGDERDGVSQPRTFQFCPLGVQLYNRRELAICGLVEFTLELPHSSGSAVDCISCTGIVAQCEFDPELALYRIWVKFLDLPASARDRIHALTKSENHLCPFCENF